MITLTINGKKKHIDVEGDTPLLWVLRDHLAMTGSKFGCGIGQCGACTVHLDGVATRSCILPVNAIGSQKVTTIEGLSEDGLHPLQQVWIDKQVPQCGYCQSGQIMQAASLLAANPNITDKEITTGMAGNLCRCMTYERIVDAVKQGATLYRQAKGSSQ